MNTVTGFYDIVVQLREDALGRLVGSMHRAGVISHTILQVHDDRRVELQIGAPEVTLLTSASPTGPSRALGLLQVVFASRSLSDAADIGESAVASVTARVRVDTPPPAGAGQSIDVVIDWQETTASDITVLDHSGPSVDRVRAAILAAIRQVGVRFAIPSAGAGEVLPPVTGLGVRFRSAATTRFLAVGLNLAGSGHGSPDQLLQGFLRRDFAIALNEALVVRFIRQALAAQFGSLPARYASTPDLIDHPALRILRVQRGHDGAIQAIGGDDSWGDPWALSVADAVALIQQTRCTFLTEEPAGNIVAVDVVHGAAHPYLRSAHDADQPNNLLALPEMDDVHHGGPELPVVLSDQQVCTLPNPLGGCSEESRQRVILESLDVALDTGAVVVSGQITQKTDALYVPDITATFAIRTTVGLAADGTVAATVLEPEVHLQQWYAQLFNLLTSDGVAGAVRDGLRQALQSSVDGGGLTGVFSTDVLRLLTTFGGAGIVTATPTPTAIEIRPEALLLHGRLAVAGRSAAPQARFSVLPAEPASLQRVLHAGAAWAPGGQIKKYEWDFGDGQSASTAGHASSFMVEHEYAAAGSYRACLTVTDDQGRTAQKCVTVKPGT